MPNEISDVLAERRKTHGDYDDHARVTQALKRVMEGEKGWARLNDCQREALAIIAHKIGRILSGNPNFADHWVDIGGYAKLVADRVAEQDRVSQSWADAAIKDKASWRGALTPLRGYTSEGLRAELRELGRAPPSPVGEEFAARIRAELERREPWSPDTLRFYPIEKIMAKYHDIKIYLRKSGTPDDERLLQALQAEIDRRQGTPADGGQHARVQPE